MWQNLSIQPNDSIFIELEFEKTPGDTVDNIAEVSACNNSECKDTFINIASSASFITDPAPYVPEEYEMSIEKEVANCDGMTVADFP